MALALLQGCAGRREEVPAADPAEVRAQLLRLLPTQARDREGWAKDIQVAFEAQRIPPSKSNLCAVLAVTEQESTFTADPQVPSLGRIAREEIDRRAARLHIPRLLIDGALKTPSGNGQSYQQRLQAVRSEKQLSELYDEVIARLPLGRTLLGGLNPVHTGGPMQVSIDFAEQHAQGYPLYRFADFNAGWYASRNAAFQAALSKVTGVRLALDGDLIAPGSIMPGATETAARKVGGKLGLRNPQIRRQLEDGDSLAFEDSKLYAGVFALADAAAGKPLPRAVLPGIELKSPKITRKLTTAWFAGRVDERYQRCMKR
ncbi:MAG: DUF1615 domain-containing protein [Pseudomonas sp.]|nr:DUF1615 domain-containing protein [Pseudomonas sp.]MBS6036038.1 DUF1615 domain-containing protein [Pseudomonas sp.]